MRARRTASLLTVAALTVVLVAPTVAAHEQFECGSTYDIPLGDDGQLRVDGVTIAALAALPDGLQDFDLELVDATGIDPGDHILHTDWQPGDPIAEIWADAGHADITFRVTNCDFA